MIVEIKPHVATLVISADEWALRPKDGRDESADSINIQIRNIVNHYGTGSEAFDLSYSVLRTFEHFGACEDGAVNKLHELFNFLRNG